MLALLSVGKPTEKVIRRHKLIMDGVDALLNTARPGIKGKELFAIARQLYKEAGFPMGTSCIGHGLKLSIHEAPNLSAENETPLEPNMVLCFELAIKADDNLLFLEDETLITKDGNEPIITMSEELQIV